MRNVIIPVALALALLGCGNPPGGDAKGKTAQNDKKGDAKKADAKRDAKGADAKKADAKADAKQADAKNPDAEKPDTAGDAEAPTEPAEDAGPDEVKLAEVAKAIAAKPADADAILEQNGMDRPAFEAAMVTIAKDQWKTDLFLTAYQPPAAGG